MATNSTVPKQALSASSTTLSAAQVNWVAQRIQAGELAKPGPEFDDFTRKLLVALWLETVAEVGPDRFDAAFRQVLKTSPYRPDISEIRKAAGINRGLVDPTEQAALKALVPVLQALRKHGPELKVIQGGMDLANERDEQGRIRMPLPRLPDTPAPTFEGRTEAAILELGYGNWEAGLEVLSCHPALPWNAQKTQEEAATRSFRLKNQAELEKRWVQAWAGVR